jgi:hypothetical protein
MSAEQSSISVLRPLAHGDPGAGADDHMLQPPGEASQPSDPGLPLATAELANLLANGQWAATANDPTGIAADANTYDGHVALVLDTGVLPALDSTLDLLTSSHHLFDVPALDVPPDPGDASSA